MTWSQGFAALTLGLPAVPENSFYSLLPASLGRPISIRCAGPGKEWTFARVRADIEGGKGDYQENGHREMLSACYYRPFWLLCLGKRAALRKSYRFLPV
jgi:hypothetical protein